MSELAAKADLAQKHTNGTPLSTRSQTCNSLSLRLVQNIRQANDEWAVQRTHYMSLETITPLSDDPNNMLSAVPTA